MSWNDVSFVAASKNRKAVLLGLESPTMPKILAERTGINLSHVSRTLTELNRKGLVVCLTPKKKVGRIYSLTEKGREVLAKVRRM